MKKILALAVAAVALSGSAFAQTPTIGTNTLMSTVTSGPVTITGTVVVPLEATVLDGNINFAQINRGGIATVNPANDAINNVNPPDAAKVAFVGDRGDNIAVTLTNSVLATTNGGGHGIGNPATMAWTTTATYRDAWVPQGGSTPFLSGATLTLGDDNSDLGTGLTYGGVASTGNDGNGAMFVWLGGSVTADANQQRGVYTGTITVTGTYNN
jgi:hypothetical protein